MISYLYELNSENMIEVKSTGRFVTRNLPMSNQSYRLMEITPVDKSLKWTKFVDEKYLQLIEYNEDYTPENSDNILRIV